MMTREELDRGERLIRAYLEVLSEGTGIGLLAAGTPVIFWFKRYGGEHETILALIAQARRAIELEEQAESAMALLAGDAPVLLSRVRGSHIRRCCRSLLTSR